MLLLLQWVNLTSINVAIANCHNFMLCCTILLRKKLLSDIVSSSNTSNNNKFSCHSRRVMKAQTACLFHTRKAQNGRMKAHRHFVTKAQIWMNFYNWQVIHIVAMWVQTNVTNHDWVQHNSIRALQIFIVQWQHSTLSFFVWYLLYLFPKYT